ncbi:MAG TPA: energy transducer TonB [Gemmatimonadaceae bacterium]|nr:energy transducer TonB [Gemmatimonadaceae bacterium]
MFGVLLESRMRRQRWNGGAVLSVVLHAALLTLAVALTAHGASTGAPPRTEKLRPAIWAGPIAPQPITESRRGAGPPSCECPIVPAIHVGNQHITVAEPPMGEFPMPNTPWAAWTGDSGSAEPRALGGGILDDEGASGIVTGPEFAARVLAAAHPRYPDALRQAGIAGHVLVELAVDTTGRVDMASLQVIESTHELFTRAVRAALPAMRLEPARVRGRKVRMLVRVPFQFTIETR